jgi:hypothetical protein
VAPAHGVLPPEACPGPLPAPIPFGHRRPDL